MEDKLYFAYLPGGRIEGVFGSTPSHLTLVSWFLLDPKVTPALTNTARLILPSFGPILAIVGEEAMHGDVEVVPVNMIEPNSLLKLLHITLLGAVEKLGGKTLYPGGCSIRYRPHIPRKPDTPLRAGDAIVVNSAHLIRSLSEEPKQREIVESYHW